MEQSTRITNFFDLESLIVKIFLLITALSFNSFAEGARLKARYIYYENTLSTDRFHSTYQLGFDLPIDGEYWMASFATYFGWLPDQVSISTDFVVCGKIPGEKVQPFIGIGPDIDYLPIHNGMDQIEGTFRSGGLGPKIKLGCEILRHYELSVDYKFLNLTSTAVALGIRI